MKFGLKGKMLLVIISLLLISFSAVAATGYIVINNNITNELNAQLIIKTDYMREKVDNFFPKDKLYWKMKQAISQLSSGK